MPRTDSVCRAPGVGSPPALTLPALTQWEQTRYTASKRQADAPGVAAHDEGQTTVERAHGSTRRSIVGALKRQHGLTANELAALLGVTSMAIRKHLAQLTAEALVGSTVERRPVGRPVHRYHLTEAAAVLFPHTADRLTVELLTDLQLLSGEETVDRLFARRTDRLVAALQGAMVGKGFEEKLEVLRAHLDAGGYRAAWEQTAEGDYLLTEHHCAVSGVATRFAQPCTSELELMRRLLPEAVIQREHHMREGGGYCCYRIHPTTPTPVTPSNG